MASQATNVRMKADQERVSHLLTDTVTLLCKNGLQYKTEMKVQGLLGITLDNEVFLVQIDKKFGELIGADAVKVHAPVEPEELVNNDCPSGSEMSEVSSQSSRKRHRRKRRRSNASETSEVSEHQLPAKLEVKSEVLDVDDDDLVMLDSDSKMGLHDKDTMRESYGVSYYGDLNKLDSNSNQDDTGQSLDESSLLGGTQDQAGCSTWEDPLSALTADQNSSMGPQAGREDLLDQQTMSTDGLSYFNKGRYCNFELQMRRGRAPYKYVCDVKTCNKRFNYKQNLLRHQTIKHGRVPTKPMRWDNLDSLPPINLNQDLQRMSQSQPGKAVQVLNESAPLQSPEDREAITDQSSGGSQQNAYQDRSDDSMPSKDDSALKTDSNDYTPYSPSEPEEPLEARPFQGIQSSQSLEALEKVTNKVTEEASRSHDSWKQQYSESLSYQQQDSTSASGDVYQCDKCEKSFNLKHNLRRHQTTKHGRPQRVLFKSLVRTPFWQ